MDIITTLHRVYFATRVIATRLRFVVASPVEGWSGRVLISSPRLMGGRIIAGVGAIIWIR